MNIKRFLRQKAVYWEADEVDGFGGISYKDAREIDVRWSTKFQTIFANDGKEIQSNAEIWVDEQLEEEGYIWLGKLNELSAGELADPKSISTAREIRRFVTIPSINGDSDIKKVFL